MVAFHTGSPQGLSERGKTETQRKLSDIRHRQEGNRLRGLDHPQGLRSHPQKDQIEDQDGRKTSLVEDNQPYGTDLA